MAMDTPGTMFSFKSGSVTQCTVSDPGYVIHVNTCLPPSSTSVLYWNWTALIVYVVVASLTNGFRILGTFKMYGQNVMP